MKRTVVTALVLMAATSAIAQAFLDDAEVSGAQDFSSSFVPQPLAPTAVLGSDVAVSWTAVTLPASQPADAYVVTRYPWDGMNLGAAQAPGGTCAGPLPGGTTACDDLGVAPGDYAYTVTAFYGPWESAESDPSAVVIVPDPVSLFSWGEDAINNSLNGRLGQGLSPVNTTVPGGVFLPPGVTATHVSAGANHTLVAGDDGLVYGWGNDGNQKLGNGGGPVAHQMVPQQLAAPTGVVQVAAGEQHSLALTAAGDLYSWGDRSDGAVGDGLTAGDQAVPALIPPASFPGLSSAITGIAAGNQLSFAWNATQLYTWGTGALADGTATRSTPVEVTALFTLNVGETFVGAAAGRSGAANGFGYALTSQGRIFAWGSDNGGRLGDGAPLADSATPVLATLPALSPGELVVGVSAGAAHGLALTNQGRVLAWGSDVNGRLGNGTGPGNGSQQAPQILGTFPAPATGVSAGTNHSLAVLADGTVYAWGNGTQGELGNGTSGPGVNSQSPIVVADLDDAVQVSAGANFSLARTIP
jgi:alpha-tubulin suppressor-like RCC1 family protein